MLYEYPAALKTARAGSACAIPGSLANPRKHKRIRAKQRLPRLLDPLEARVLLSAATINWNTLNQIISGFGSSSAWNNLGTATTSQQQLLWSTTDGIGLSILRSHINPDTSSSSGEIDSMQKAAAMGVTIFSTPWSPPAAWKSNDNIAVIVNGVNTGGYLLASHYQDWANWLKQYVINMASDGIPIYAVSMQNEPNWAADYESSIWTAQMFYDALPILHDTLAADPRTANVKIVLPEEIHWNNLDLVSMVMASTEANYTNLIYADHTYGINTVSNSTYPGKDGYTPMTNLYNLAGNPIWETEHTGDDPASGISAGLNEAQSIFDIVYVAQAGAYVHWWTNASGGAGILNGDWQVTKLTDGMAQYSEFIRPGWTAIGESDDNNGLRISAFKSTASGSFATVVVNQGSSPITETFTLNGAYAPVVTPWVTTASLDVAQQQSVITSNNGATFTYTIPAKGIVTFTGIGSATPVTEFPVGLLANSSSTSAITLTWTNNLTGATGYTIQRSTNGTSWTTVTTAIPAGTFTYTDTGLATNTQYYYRVQANNGTVFSNVDAQMTQPPAPSNLTGSYSTSSQNITLTWTGNGSSTTATAIDRSLDGGVTWTTLTADIAYNTTSYTDTTAPELSTVTYRVRSVFGLNSAATNTISVATTVLKAPTTLAVTSGGTSAVLTWVDNTSTSATVLIERSTDGVNFTQIGTANHGTQTYTDNAITEGGTYYYRIRNYYSPATTYSAYTSVVSITVPPATPTHLEVEFSPQPTLNARLLWNDNAASETAYEVDRSADNGTTWTTLTSTLPANTTTYTDPTVISGTAYQYRVKALNASTASATVNTLTETAGALPSFAHGDIGDAAVLGLAGSTVYNATNSTYTMTGSGVDIWNSSDGFQFAFTTLTGDGSITARVNSLNGTNSWAKAGLMIRDSLATNAPFADAIVSTGNGVGLQWRATAGGTPGNVQTNAIVAPIWLRLTRTGTTFRAYYSTDNVTYTQIGTGTTITMGSTVYIGLIDCAHDATQIATANFGSITLTGTGNAAPSISAAAAANPNPVTGTTSILSVTGSDDAGAANLIYNWTTSGSPPASVIYSSNGQNASKSTTVTFSKAGTYSFLVTVTDQFGLTTTSSLTLTVNQTPAATTLTPAVNTIAPSTSTQLTFATVDQFGTTMATPAGTWSIVSGAGSVNASGLFTASATEGPVTVRVVNSSGQAYYSTIDVLTQTAWYRADSTSGTTLTDSSGNAKNGTLSGAAAFGPGLSGNALSLTGGAGNLPAGIVSSLTNFTIAAWVKLSSIANWMRIFDFGTGTGNYMFLTPQNGSTGVIRFAILTPSSGGEKQLSGTAALATGSWQHVAVTLSGSTGTLYVNGTAVVTGTIANGATTITPASLGSTTQNYLGDSQFSADPALLGSIDDFRIIPRALSAAEIAALVKPTIAMAATASNITPTSATLNVVGSDITAGESSLTYNWTTTGTPPAPVTFSSNGTNAGRTQNLTFTKPGTYNFTVTATNPAGYTTSSSTSVTIVTTIAGRHLFYNNSAFDTSNDNAIATDKSALLPGGGGQTASFANYSSFDRGINGIMVDVAGLVGNLSTSDFTFRIGNSNNTASWTAAANPISIAARPNTPAAGTTRFDITWADGAIQNTWLQVTLKGGTGSTSGLAADDVFYFGNAIGDSGNDPASARVDATDQLMARSYAGPAAITNPCDYNRDGTVNTTDESIARTHATTFLTDLQLITAPAGPGGASLPVGDPQTGPIDDTSSQPALTAPADTSSSTDAAPALAAPAAALPQVAFTADTALTFAPPADLLSRPRPTGSTPVPPHAAPRPLIQWHEKPQLRTAVAHLPPLTVHTPKIPALPVNSSILQPILHPFA